MKREFGVALVGAAIVVAGLSGCSSNKACNGASCAAGGEGTAKVTVDGKDQSVSGKILCVTTGDTVDMTVGDQTKGATTAEVKGPDVTHVSIWNGTTALAYVKGTPQMPGAPASDATSTKDGNTYKISGHLMGTGDMSSHPFTMEITCP